MFDLMRLNYAKIVKKKEEKKDFNNEKVMAIILFKYIRACFLLLICNNQLSK
jgi:hypothetical protein